MKSNLHTHSFFSDGSESPEQVAKLADEAKVRIIALSDHNTFAGWERFSAACSRLGIRAIKAVEIDCIQPEIGFNSELLAYFPDGGGQELQPILDRQTEARKKRVDNAIARAKAMFNIDDKRFNHDYFHSWVVEKSGYDLWYSGGVAPLYLSNKQFHRFLIERWAKPLPDYATTQESAWWRELWAVDEPAITDTLHSNIRAVAAAGGYPVLPHFGIYCKFDPDEMAKNSGIYLRRLRTMQALGLWGMEIHPYRYKAVAPALNAQVSLWANQLGLHLTAGSDFHGEYSTHYIFDGMSFDFDGF